ncbi:MAG: hypothetical protein SAL70_22560 [Scytonema sp. PMC 1070.18]|nr:hypothetical protein [Scytonema sp. PMC 1070.18]
MTRFPRLDGTFVAVTFDVKLGGKLWFNDKKEPTQDVIQSIPINIMFQPTFWFSYLFKVLTRSLVNDNHLTPK